MDMISIVTDLWKKSDFRLIKKYVFVHQDDLYMPLSMLEKLNCRMDHLAKDIAQGQIRLPQASFLPRT